MPDLSLLASTGTLVSVGTTRRDSESDDQALVGHPNSHFPSSATPPTDTTGVTDITVRLSGRSEAPRLSPRLLNVHAAAAYLSVSTWTIRDWVAAGHLIPVDLPPLRPREGDRGKLRLRRLLFDRAVLDQFVDGLSGARR